MLLFIGLWLQLRAACFNAETIGDNDYAREYAWRPGIVYVVTLQRTHALRHQLLVLYRFCSDRFYRYTLCVRSAVFAVARCPSICTSDRLSRCSIVSTRLISSNFFFWPDSTFFLVFDPERRYVPILTGTPSAGRKIHGVGKNCDFRLQSPFISELRPMVAMEC